MSEVTFTNVSNPAAFGVEWTAGDSGSRMQLVNPRGTESLAFGLKVKGSDEWSTMRVVDPSRFGMTGPPKTFSAFRVIAERYVNAA